jgi:hypothetical protein
MKQVQGVDDLLRDPAARERGLGVGDGADLLVDAPGDLVVCSTEQGSGPPILLVQGLTVTGAMFRSEGPEVLIPGERVGAR